MSVSPSKNNSFKLSQLAKITNVDDNDLLLVSDRDAKQPLATKKMEMIQVADYMRHALSSSIEQIVNKAVKQALSGDIQEVVDQSIDDMLADYKRIKPTVLSVLDEYGDHKIDNQIVVDGNT